MCYYKVIKQNDEEKTVMKRIISLFLAVLMLAVQIPAYAQENGVNMSFNTETGELYINGSGTVTSSDVYECIAMYGIYDKDYIKSVVIEDGITEIGKEAFEFCEIEKIVFPQSLKIINDNAFMGGLLIKELVLPYGVEEIGDSAFRGCDFEGKLVLPDSIAEIGESAFSGIPITEVKLPQNLIEIKEDTFYGCTKLRKVDFPQGLKSIGGEAFYKCWNLNEMNFPDSLEEIAYDSFIQTVWYDKSPRPLYAGKVLVDFLGPETKGLKEYVVPEDINGFAEFAFSNCSLESLIVPEGIKKLPYRVFCECRNLKSVKLPESLEEICTLAFDECSSLEQINIPAGVHTIYGDAFKKAKWFEEAPYPLVINKILMKADLDEYGRLIVPEEAEHIAGGLDIEGSEYSDLISVEIHDGVRSIGDYAFSDCKNLTTVNIPDSVKKIGRSAFYSSGLTGRIEVPASVETVGRYAFGKTNITEAHIESENGTVNDMFYGCSSLEKVTFGESVTEIAGATFYECSKLNTVILPDGLKKIGSSAFYGCTSLKEISLPQSLEKIGSFAFYDTQISELFIPDNTETISERILLGANGPINIYVGASVKNISLNAFGGADVTVHTPKNSAAYFAAASSGAKIVLTSGTRIGEKYSEVIETDIVTTINSIPINAYAIDGETVILIRDLESKGFDVSFDESTKTAYASFNSKKQSTDSIAVELTSKDVLYTDIKVYVNGVELTGYNINGYMAVVAEDMGRYIPDISATWRPSDRELRMLASEDIATVDYLIDEIGSRKGLEAVEGSEYFVDAKSVYTDACVKEGYIEIEDYDGLLYPDSGLTLYMFSTIAGRSAYGSEDEDAAKKNIQTETDETIDYTNIPIFVRSYITRLYRAGVINGEEIGGKTVFDINYVLTKSEVKEILNEIL